MPLTVNIIHALAWRLPKKRSWTAEFIGRHDPPVTPCAGQRFGTRHFGSADPGCASTANRGNLTDFHTQEGRKPLHDNGFGQHTSRRRIGHRQSPGGFTPCLSRTDNGTNAQNANSRHPRDVSSPIRRVC